MVRSSIVEEPTNRSFGEFSAVRASIGGRIWSSLIGQYIGLPQLGASSTHCEWQPVQMLGNASSICVQVSAPIRLH